MPAAVWRELLEEAASRAGLDVRTFVVPQFPRAGVETDGQLIVIVLVGRLPEDQQRTRQRPG